MTYDLYWLRYYDIFFIFDANSAPKEADDTVNMIKPILAYQTGLPLLVKNSKVHEKNSNLR